MLIERHNPTYTLFERQDRGPTEMPRKLLLLLLSFVVFKIHAAEYPKPVEADFVLKNFHFTSGETLPELRIHYRTIGKPERDAQGIVKNAVLVMHGTHTLTALWKNELEELLRSSSH
jgi:hypothetical protein